MSYDNRLPADKIAALEPGALVTLESSIGAFSGIQLRTGKVVRLTAKQIVVHYESAGRTIETRFRKEDAGKVGKGYGYLLDPEHPSTVSRLDRDRREGRRQTILTLADRWSRQRDNLDLLQQLQAAIGEHLDAES
jgi:hypothetical protein